MKMQFGKIKATAFILAAVVVIIAGIFAAFIFTPGWSYTSEKGIVLPNNGEQTGSQGGITDIPKAEFASKYSLLQITKSNVKDVIQTMSRPANYSFDSKVQFFDGEKEYSPDLMKSYVMDSHVKTEHVNSSGKIIKNVITDDSRVFIWGGNNAYYYKGARGDISADDNLMSLTYEDIGGYPDSAITGAGYEEKDGVYCVFVEFTQEISKGVEYTNRFWVSAEYGLLIRAETQKQGKMIYLMTVSNINTKFNDESIFLLPDGKSALKNE